MIDQQEREALGQQAYQVYGLMVGNVNYQNIPMPFWRKLPAHVKEAWIMVALVMASGEPDGWLQGKEDETGLKRLK